MGSNVTDDDTSRAIRRSITAVFFNAVKVGNDGRYDISRGRHIKYKLNVLSL